MVLVGISLVINHVEHIFMHIFSLYIFSMAKCLLKTFAPFLIWGVYFLILEF